ncbi:extracellular solute-binding protein [Microterricola pindariensis]|uniref:Spermidine/putrescine ABC transporter substrate-binding protein n=1 Tax=Microterricola pindariensis TaxID=478010 RepID=A0ABX5ATV2_9MICO|nr:extracellular solute-binding protein [Microterricola pindariensis]PPL16203.1 spermidine/putrescine ABC transporter substrate-binding protein [Microterricola pindariensis]
MPPATHRVVLALLAAAALSLTACGASGGGSGDDAATTLGEKEGSVSILARPGYVEDGSNQPAVDWVSPFEKDTGCTVTSTIYDTSDQAFNLMKSGEYDVIAASGDASVRLIDAGILAPTNTDLIPNYAGIYDYLKMQPWNSLDGVAYGVPHGYGANLLMYNADVVSPAPTSWDVVFDKGDAYSGKVTAYDSPIYIADAALYLMTHRAVLGIQNPYALDTDQLAAAVTLLTEQRGNIGEYWSDYRKAIQSFESGDAVVGTTWQVIANGLADGFATEVTVPSEGVTGWSDTWMIASGAKNPNCAYAWLNYIASPEANGQATGFFGQAPSSQAACEFRSAGSCGAYHAGDADYASTIWFWVTPVADCLDGRSDVRCTDYADWTAAWQQITR